MRPAGFTLSARSARAFTLIELLVVISIIAILGVAVLINYKDFSQNQVLDEAISQVQTLLRLAQANATAGVLCNVAGESGADWRVNFRDVVNIDLECSSNNFVDNRLVKTLALKNVQIDSVKSPTCSASCSSSSCLPLYVAYSKVDSSVKINGNDQSSCFNSSNQILINIQNLKTKNIKSFTISKGGAIDAQ